MGNETKYPKRLIEVDLPIKEISAHARREKSIRHGHISTLHIWWARRPLAACRAVICAALWWDPADDLCPEDFRHAVKGILCRFAEQAREHKDVQELVQEHWGRWRRLAQGAWDTRNPACWWDMRYALLDFIADFANWDASNRNIFLETARALTQAAHKVATPAEGPGRPLVFDPFAGGGSFPLEALRVGANAFASDLNPIPVMLNRIQLDYIPRYGKKLAEDVREWGTWLCKKAFQELAPFYATPYPSQKTIAYIWARTIRCEGPGCGVEVPLLRSPWLSKSKNSHVGFQLKISSDGHEIQHAISANSKAEIGPATTKGGAATCPICGFTTSVESVRSQLSSRFGGADDAKLMAVVYQDGEVGGRMYRLPSQIDLESFKHAKDIAKDASITEATPYEELNHLRGFFNVVLYGMSRWRDLFSPRQRLSLVTFWRILRDSLPKQISQDTDGVYLAALQTTLACVVARATNGWSSVCRWNSVGEKVEGTFARQALPMLWDFAEANPFSTSTGNFMGAVEWVAKVCENLEEGNLLPGQALPASATSHPLQDNSADLLATDPPYYDAVPYADLSDYFYVWHRRTLSEVQPDLFFTELSPKEKECVTLAHRAAMYRNKDRAFFESMMLESMREARRIVKPTGIGIVVFANKSTAGWEAMLSAMVEAGWIVTGSWPIDTEMGSRLRAHGSATLSSSVHLVCRPREEPDGSLRTSSIGDWRSVLHELPERIHDWMPRLAKEGIVGADAIFACLGPALEVFSRYARVEKANGERVTLREYLEQVWAVVAREALAMIFEEADTTGLEEDARLTAMWLWTLSTASNGSALTNGDGAEESDGGDEDAGGKARHLSGFTLEYDAARKIAQGLGAHLETLRSLVEIKGDTARLLPVAERTRYLFGKEAVEPAGQRRTKKNPQMGLFQELEAAEEQAEWRDTGAPAVGSTVLDRVHQAMILFAAGRAEALKRFLVEEAVGRDTRFWKLAQSLSALYLSGTDEKRWVDGVLARKKGLGFG